MSDSFKPYNSDWATNCPEHKVRAVQATRVTQQSEWQNKFETLSFQTSPDRRSLN
jgi:hypothetical protein